MKTTNVKRTTMLILLALAAFALASCAPAAEPTATGDSYVSEVLPADYEGALSARNQLALGTLRLEGTALAPTSAEAQALIPLWQALRSLQTSGASAPEEMNALLAQIESTMRAEQLQQIAALGLTNADMQAWAAENGLQTGTGGGTGQGQGQGMSPEARATRQAEQGVTSASSSGSRLSSAMIDAVIAYLQSIQP